MIYNNVRHECNLYNFFFAPRGNRRVMGVGHEDYPDVFESI